jgi:hypothetical protein
MKYENLIEGDTLVSRKDYLQSSPIMDGEKLTIVKFYDKTVVVTRNNAADVTHWQLDGDDYGVTFDFESKVDKKEKPMKIDSHYNFFYMLSPEEIEAKQIKVDPYFVSKQWRVGERDTSGALFHSLKTIARFGDKNPKEREIKAIYLQIKRLAELEGVELE